MNFNKFINSDYLKSNPLCGINTYKDELNLSTGACTRQIEKLVLDGTEDWQNYGQAPNTYRLSISNAQSIGNPAICSHFVNSPISEIISGKFTVGSTWIYIRYADATDFKAYLVQQYAAGTPVTVWYVLATPTTETITVPSGLSGIEEGYLNQSGTPTPTNPIYPTANTVEKWFDLNHYIMGTSTDTLTTLPADLYADGTNATVGLKGNMEQSGTPTPSAPIQPQECGELETKGAKAGQYKIPISSANTTTTVYLGEVQSTRKIKKYEFTGNELFYGRSGSPSSIFFVAKSDISMDAIAGYGICNNYAYSTGGSFDNLNNNEFIISATNIGFRNTSYTTVPDFKAYLQQQYAAGTPVTVWYVLANETTGIVNEPIRKIGDYADEVSDITIPTIAGANSFDVLTTLKPSEVTVNYKGWHTGAVHERDGGQWD